MRQVLFQLWLLVLQIWLWNEFARKTQKQKQQKYELTRNATTFRIVVEFDHFPRIRIKEARGMKPKLINAEE